MRVGYFAALLVLTGCAASGDGPLSPGAQALLGSYHLFSVNGQPLPYYIGKNNGVGADIYIGSGTLAMQANHYDIALTATSYSHDPVQGDQTQTSTSPVSSGSWNFDSGFNISTQDGGLHIEHVAVFADSLVWKVTAATIFGGTVTIRQLQFAK